MSANGTKRTFWRLAVGSPLLTQSGHDLKSVTRRGRIQSITQTPADLDVSDGIIAHYVSFQFEFIEAMFEYVADANDSHELMALLDG